MLFNPKDHIGGNSSASQLTPGDYDVFIKSIDLREGKKAPYYFVRLTVCAGECKGAGLVEIVSHSEAPYCRLKLAEFVYSFGFTEPFDTEKDFATLCAAATNNQAPIKITIDYEEGGDDEPRLRVKSFHPRESVFNARDEFADMPGSDDNGSDDDIPF